MKRKAIVTGVTGQDGSYLAEFLLEQGYEVVGVVRRTSTINFERIQNIQDRITIVQGDLIDQVSLIEILQDHRPAEVYNLAAQSYIPTSFKQPVLTGEVTAAAVRPTQAAAAAPPAIDRSPTSTIQAAVRVPATPTTRETQATRPSRFMRARVSPGCPPEGRAAHRLVLPGGLAGRDRIPATEEPMNNYEAANIRNVLLAGHGGSGKTTLLEAMLFTSGAITRMGRIEDGNTASDHEPEEVKKGISVSLSMAPVEWGGTKINVLDAPGYADFVGDMRAAVRAADAMLIVVSAVDGVEVQTEAAWELAVEFGIPRAIFVNKMDRERADFERTQTQLIAAFGKQVAPVELPIGAEAGFRGVADLLHRKADMYSGGGPVALSRRCSRMRSNRIAISRRAAPFFGHFVQQAGDLSGRQLDAEQAQLQFLDVDLFWIEQLPRLQVDKAGP